MRDPRPSTRPPNGVTILVCGLFFYLKVKYNTFMIRVMVFGVFDLLHPGHKNFLKQAKRLGDFLIVSVARDKNVKKIKGHKPREAEKVRVQALKKISFVDHVVLGGVTSPWSQAKPDIIALGYDQRSYVLMKELKKIAKVVRLKSYQPKKYKTKYLRTNTTIHRRIVV
jgi:FAD synthetase